MVKMKIIMNISFLLAILIITCADWGEYWSREDSTGFSILILFFFIWFPLSIFSLYWGGRVVYFFVKEKRRAVFDALFASWLTFGSVCYYNLGGDVTKCLSSSDLLIIIFIKAFMFLFIYLDRMNIFKETMLLSYFFYIIFIVIVIVSKIEFDYYFYATIISHIATNRNALLRYHNM